MILRNFALFVLLISFNTAMSVERDSQEIAVIKNKNETYKENVKKWGKRIIRPLLVGCLLTYSGKLAYEKINFPVASEKKAGIVLILTSLMLWYLHEYSKEKVENDKLFSTHFINFYRNILECGFGIGFGLLLPTSLNLFRKN